jgi:hypothetical protein
MEQMEGMEKGGITEEMEDMEKYGIKRGHRS